jgi:hypothetical protein
VSKPNPNWYTTLDGKLGWQHDTRGSRTTHEWPPFTMTTKESGRVLPHPSACLPRDTSMGTRGWSTHYPSVHPLSNIGYHPTQWPSKLLSLQDPIMLSVLEHNQCLFHWAQLTRSLINTGRGYQLQSSEHENSPLSSFPSGILHFPLVAPHGLLLCHILKVKAVNHIGPPSIAYTTKHSLLSLTFVSLG